jgi:hypothetical protein
MKLKALKDVLVIVAVTALTLSHECRAEGSGRRSRATTDSCSPATCRLPACYCAGEEAPVAGVRRSEVPQFVMVTFDDAITDAVYEAYEVLLSTKARNPNGCPPTLTFFVSHEWTNYSRVSNRVSHSYNDNLCVHRNQKLFIVCTCTYLGARFILAGSRDGQPQHHSPNASELVG